jgi:hypothetical protein
MGNIVAKRCESLKHEEDRDLVLFLQSISHSSGGLNGLAEELMRKHAGRISTRQMQSIGCRGGQIYSAGEVRAIRSEIQNGRDEFLLKGEKRSCDRLWESILPESDEDGSSQDNHPTSYDATRFSEFCQSACKRELPELLERICLDPSFDLRSDGPWFFPDLVSSLREFQKADAQDKSARVVVTELGKQVCATLNYALESGCLVIIDGLARTGKTFSARAWCEQRLGRVRYVQVPSANDDIGFFRAIAKSLGVSINLNSKAQQLRDRIEETIHRTRLMLCLDEAHYLWPQSNYRHALPTRVNWIMTALVNMSVPVALITTPQFLRAQRNVEDRSSWTSEQFIGRIGHYQKLPDSLSPGDLQAVAKSLLPEGDPKSIEILRAYAQGSAKYLAGIEAVVRRARFLANQEGRSSVLLIDVKRSIKESVIPSDSALAGALADTASKRKGRPATPLQRPFEPSATPGQEGEFLAETSRISAGQPAGGQLSAANSRQTLGEALAIG